MKNSSVSVQLETFALLWLLFVFGGMSLYSFTIMAEANPWQPDRSSLEKLHEQLESVELEWVAAYDQDPFGERYAEANWKRGVIIASIEYYKEVPVSYGPRQYSEDIGMGRAVLTAVEMFLPR